MASNARSPSSDMIDDFIRKVPSCLREKSGKVFFSGRAAFEYLVKPLYILGLNPGLTSDDQRDRRRLFVIDGAKALRSAIGHVFGVQNPVQRCRNRKVRNVLGYLPKAQHDQARSTLGAA